MIASAQEPRENILAHSVESIPGKTGIGRTSIIKAIREGQLLARKMGRRTIVVDDDLRKWLNSLPPLRKRVA
jgi:hypothetical protein